MSLNTFWFLTIATLWIGYFVLEGFDFGLLDFSSIAVNCAIFNGPNLVLPFLVSIELAVFTFVPLAPFAILVS
jgi:hypothetical protein